tara:strand:+ start:1189 stop:1410 length:222 start_codon:yes stop_codon:yes gene_type:complete
MTRFALLLPAAVLLLSACSDEKTPEANATEEAGPQGQVYGGTISDAMLPLGELESQSPQRGGDEEDQKKDDAE